MYSEEDKIITETWIEIKEEEAEDLGIEEETIYFDGPYSTLKIIEQLPDDVFQDRPGTLEPFEEYEIMVRNGWIFEKQKSAKEINIVSIKCDGGDKVKITTYRKEQEAETINNNYLKEIKKILQEKDIETLEKTEEREISTRDYLEIKEAVKNSNEGWLEYLQEATIDGL